MSHFGKKTHDEITDMSRLAAFQDQSACEALLAGYSLKYSSERLLYLSVLVSFFFFFFVLSHRVVCCSARAAFVLVVAGDYGDIVTGEGGGMAQHFDILLGKHISVQNRLEDSRVLT